MKKIILIVSLLFLTTGCSLYDYMAINKNESVKNESSTNKEVEDYTTLNLKEILEAEEIEPSFDELKENDDQVIIYLFHGQGSIFCRNFLEYLNKIYEDEGDKFKVVTFQIWGDTSEAQANDALLREVVEFIGVAEPEKTGVPFIVIGSRYFPGFTEEVYGEAVLRAIDSEYKKDKAYRYDLFKAMNEEEEKSPVSFPIIEIKG